MNQFLSCFILFVGNKLAIVNGKYAPLPPNPRLICLHDIVKGCLEVSPVRRLTTSMILERLAAIAESNNFEIGRAHV